MSRRARPHYRSGLGWILGVAFVDTLTRPVRLAQGFTFVRCCGAPRASSPHGLAAPGPASLDGIALRAVASGSRLLPTRPAKDFHLQSSAHARHTYATPHNGNRWRSFAGKPSIGTETLFRPTRPPLSDGIQDHQEAPERRKARGRFPDELPDYVAAVATG